MCTLNQWLSQKETPNLAHPAKVKVAVFWKICMFPNVWVGLLSFDIFSLSRVMDRLSYITVGEKNKGKMIFCFLYHNTKNLIHFTFIHGRERRGSSISSLELLLPPDEVMEGRAICFSEQVTLPLGKKKKKKSHSIASVHNSHPQPQIDLESLFKIIKMKKNIEEKSYKATHTQQKKKLISI